MNWSRQTRSAEDLSLQNLSQLYPPMLPAAHRQPERGLSLRPRDKPSAAATTARTIVALRIVNETAAGARCQPTAAIAHHQGIVARLLLHGNRQDRLAILTMTVTRALARAREERVGIVDRRLRAPTEAHRAEIITVRDRRLPTIETTIDSLDVVVTRARRVMGVVRDEMQCLQESEASAPSASDWH
jgi:hypothetical protein